MVEDIASIASDELAVVNLHMAEAMLQQLPTSRIQTFQCICVRKYIGAHPCRSQRCHKYQAGCTKLQFGM